MQDQKLNLIQTTGYEDVSLISITQLQPLQYSTESKTVSKTNYGTDLDCNFIRTYSHCYQHLVITY
jgi:hypothetical protein